MKFQILTLAFQLCFVFIGINSTPLDDSIVEAKLDALKHIASEYMFDPLYDSLSAKSVPERGIIQSELGQLHKRFYTVKRYRPIVYDGYTLDINVDLFKSTVKFFKIILIYFIQLKELYFN